MEDLTREAGGGEQRLETILECDAEDVEEDICRDAVMAETQSAGQDEQLEKEERFEVTLSDSLMTDLHTERETEEKNEACEENTNICDEPEMMSDVICYKSLSRRDQRVLGCRVLMTASLLSIVILASTLCWTAQPQLLTKQPVRTAGGAGGAHTEQKIQEPRQSREKFTEREFNLDCELRC